MKSIARVPIRSLLKCFKGSYTSSNIRTPQFRLFSINVEQEPSEKIRRLSDEILNLDVLEVNQFMQGMAVCRYYEFIWNFMTNL